MLRYSRTRACPWGRLTWAQWQAPSHEAFSASATWWLTSPSAPANNALHLTRRPASHRSAGRRAGDRNVRQKKQVAPEGPATSPEPPCSRFVGQAVRGMRHHHEREGFDVEA